jgi:hypothetical protein
MSPSKKQTRTQRAEVLARLRQEQARQERRRRLLLAGAVVAAVLIVVAALVGIGLSTSHDHTAGSGSGSSSASTQVVKTVSSVPASTLDAIGAGSIKAGPSKISAPALSDGGKPEVLYVGAEYCPYCAAQRWPLTVALSRFGTWSHLGQTHSASADVFPDTPTLSFHGASFDSDYLAFTGVETTSNKPEGGSYAPLDKLTGPEQKLVDTYNRPPYVSGQAGSIPFVDIAGRYVSSGASYSPQLLAGKSHAQVAAALADPSSAIAQAVDGTADVYTAALCQVTDQKPAKVCTSQAVTKAAAALGGK